MKRPLGVTALGWFSVIGGIILLIVGVILTVVGMVLPSTLRDEVITANELVTGMPMDLLGIFASMIGLLLIGAGAFSWFVGWGFLKGKKWAWTLMLISTFIGIALGVYSLTSDIISGIISLIIDLLILYYLYRPHVREYFGKTNTKMSTSSA